MITTGQLKISIDYNFRGTEGSYQLGQTLGNALHYEGNMSR